MGHLIVLPDHIQHEQKQIDTELEEDRRFLRRTLANAASAIAAAQELFTEEACAERDRARAMQAGVRNS